MTQNFTIDKGEHYSYRHKILGIPILAKISPTFKDILEFDAVFNYTCKYSSESNGINKLYGLQYAMTPQEGSVMIGWRYSVEAHRIELFSLVSDGGKIKQDRIGSAAISFPCKFRILIKDNRIVVTNIRVADMINSTILIKRKPWKLKFRLWPYMESAAQHNVKIKIIER